MIDFAIFFVLFLIIAALVSALFRRNASTIPRRLFLLLQGPLFAVAALIVFQMLLLLFSRTGTTVLSMIDVMMPFLVVLDSVFVLLLVSAVVALGIYLSFRQFSMWEKSRARLLEMTEWLRGRSESELKMWSDLLGGDLKSTLNVARAGSVATPLIGVFILALSLGFLGYFLWWAGPHFQR